MVTEGRRGAFGDRTETATVRRRARTSATAPRFASDSCPTQLGFCCYFFFPGPPGFACVEENGETGVPAFGLGCLGFFASLLLLNCPLAMRVSPAEDYIVGRSARTQLPAAALEPCVCMPASLWSIEV